MADDLRELMEALRNMFQQLGKDDPQVKILLGDHTPKDIEDCLEKLFTLQGRGMESAESVCIEGFKPEQITPLIVLIVKGETAFLKEMTAPVSAL